MKRVYKYPIIMMDHQRIKLPKGAGVIHADMGRINTLGFGLGETRSLCLWAIVDDEQTEEVEVDIYVAGTGHPLPYLYGEHGANFLRTVMDGEFVWHIFYRTAAKTLAAEALEGLQG